jgi:hypothetical protein
MALHRLNAKTLGFFPKGAFEDHAKRRQIIVALEADGNCLGYAIRIGKRWKIQEPVSLNTLRKRRAGFRPPQSYHYWKLDELLQISGEVFSSRVKNRTPISASHRN